MTRVPLRKLHHLNRNAIMQQKSARAIALGILACALTACEPSRDAQARSTSEAVASKTVESAQSTAAAAVRYVTAPTGNAARYRIREQLVGLDLPNDAVGETNGVTGEIAVDSKGNIIASASKFTVDVAALKSDKDRRDNFVRRRVLETEQHPTVTFVPKSVRGITLPLPKSGKKTFELAGDLTVRGTTRPTVWKVDATFQPDRMTGAATTSFTFTDFGMTQPKVPVVLSVDETIKLEMDFTLVQQASR
jgi:polyisoprenoid-binding protein YceI